MRFTSALTISAIAFLGASAAPNSPPSYGTDTSSASSGVTNPGNSGTGSTPGGNTGGSNSGNPGTGSTPGGNTGGNNPGNPGTGNNPPTGGENSNNGLGNACPSEAKSVCCNTVEGAKTVDQQLAPPPSGLLSGLLDNLIGTLDIDGLLDCGLSGVIGNGNCNHQTICCTAINSPNQTCTAKQGSSIAINIPINLGVLGSASSSNPTAGA